VGDTEAPSCSDFNDWQLMEGTSITAAAAVSLSLLTVFLLQKFVKRLLEHFSKKLQTQKT
jgi:hypothetical protein